MMTPTKINVAFILPEEVAEIACELSKGIAKQVKTEFHLDNKNFLPHISIYWTEYPNRAFKEISQITEELCKELSAVVFEFEKIRVSHNYVYLDLKKTDKIQEVHSKFLFKLNKIRNNHLREKYSNQEYLYSLTETEREMIKLYGYPYSANLYHPHITLNKLSEGETLVFEKGFKLANFVCNEIGVFEMGENGTCTKLVNAFNL